MRLRISDYRMSETSLLSVADLNSCNSHMFLHVSWETSGLASCGSLHTRLKPRKSDSSQVQARIRRK
jgi:hypothetical protein